MPAPRGAGLAQIVGPVALVGIVRDPRGIWGAAFVGCYDEEFSA